MTMRVLLRLVLATHVLALTLAIGPVRGSSHLRQVPVAAQQPLPVFFFHGVTSGPRAGSNYNANLTAEGRLFVGLDFCPDLCSISALSGQVQSAIAVIRATVAADMRFSNGYVFIGHSQGATIARGVIEEMDDHKVKLFISLAGAQNGIFYGPQASDAVPMLAFAKRLGPKTIPSALFDFSRYTPEDYATGKFQVDFNAFVFAHPSLQSRLGVLNLGRSPLELAWRKLNTFLPVLNNINPCDQDDDEQVPGQDTACRAAQRRRRDNFLRVQSAHFFGSPDDDVIAPWQSALLGQYSDVATTEDLAGNFPWLRVLDMRDTDEYVQDTYGLRTLDAEGRLFRYAVPKVGHSCWLADSTPLGTTDVCRFRPLYDDYIYPLLHTHGWGTI